MGDDNSAKGLQVSLECSETKRRGCAGYGAYTCVFEQSCSEKRLLSADSVSFTIYECCRCTSSAVAHDRHFDGGVTCSALFASPRSYRGRGETPPRASQTVLVCHTS